MAFLSKNSLKGRAQGLLSLADVKIGGDRPWDLAVHHEGFYQRVLRQGSLGLGESYMDGWWDCEALDEFFCRILSAGLELKALPSRSLVISHLHATFFNPQKKSRAAAGARGHYDLGNELYVNMLDQRLVYTSGNWEFACNLDEAQEAKLDFVCRKLNLAPGMKILDIGCGWGSFATYAAEKYGVEVVGITVSREQVLLGRQLCEGLPIEIRLQDYRDVNESFDRIVSLGMFEHVGYKNYRKFMEVAHRSLRKGGLFFLSTIGANQSAHFTDPWLDKYIFPASMIPSIKQIGAAIEGLFVMEDWQNWRNYYDRTLMAWFKNFHENWDKIKPRYGQRFYRMWKYYLLASAGTFRSKKNQLWEILLSPRGAVRG